VSLFETDRHEPLLDVAWSETRSRDAIRAIVGDLEATLGSGVVWPWHPLDAGKEPEREHKSLYLGASGVLWTMWYLEQQGAVTLRTRPSDLIERIHQAYLAEPDTGEVVPSFFLGEVGILLVLWRLTGSSEAADRLLASIKGNIANPTNEALWGAPGTMVAALHMLGWTGEHRWHDLFLENVEQLWRTWLPSEHARCHLWTQDLYGSVVQLLGSGHGFAGNAYPLLRGASLLPAERRETLYERCVETLRATAMIEGDCANWPPGVGPPRPGRTKMLVQWCHGAPGIVTGLADFPRDKSPDMDAMLVQAGNMVWSAGPLAKGHGLCHGTAGNGYAFLKLHRRTGDPIWLERARSFAMHAIAQSEQMRQQYGRGRYTLWTGDPGLAIYLWHCLNGSDGVPALDILD
jgi:lantibiotic modifying enzyme